MKFSLHKIPLLTLFTFISVSVINCISEAQQLNVIQVKGNRAIVEVQTGEKLKVGESYAVGKVDGEVSLDPVASGKGTRNKLIGFDFSLSNTKTDVANSQTILSLNTTVKYGWNKKQYEYGPLVSFNYSKTGSVKPAYGFGLGAFGTYNFQPNVVGTDMIFSADADFVFGQATSNADVKTNTMTLTAGPFVKWFGISDDHCLRGGLVFSWDKSSTSGAADTTTTGILASVGLSTYF